MTGDKDRKDTLEENHASILVVDDNPMNIFVIVEMLKLS